MSSTLELPGFGDTIFARAGAKGVFPIAVFEETFEAPLRSKRDLLIMEIVNSITDKPEWNKKVYQDNITSKWRSELSAMNVEGDDYEKISPKMIDWVIEELKYKAELFEANGCIEGLDGVFKSDTSISDSLKDRLKVAVAKLEDVPDKLKDWHPKSNEQVLDLVHPSLYPLVYGQSEILAKGRCGVDDWKQWIGKGQTLPLPNIENADDHDGFSTRFQWLPSEFVAAPDTEEVKVTSYINNLRPDIHPELYKIIPEIVAKSIPLWNRVLSYVTFEHLIDSRVDDWQANGGDGQGYNKDHPEFEFDDNEESDAYGERYDAWAEAKRIVPPDSKPFTRPEDRAKPLKYGDKSKAQMYDHSPVIDLRKLHSNLQIIVKLANIHLTPEKPTYGGGTWHVEGQANEAICATALYYYDSKNIGDSKLAFRQRTDEGTEIPYPQGEHRAVFELFDIQEDAPCIQTLGSILTREDRLLAFANVMQHQVQPFELVDKTKPGHRKILALFLVDPNIKIISTENIPPQQQDWWNAVADESGVLRTLPVELQDTILNAQSESSKGCPMSLERAKIIRDELMEERGAFVVKGNEKFEEEVQFALCEH